MQVQKDARLPRLGIDSNVSSSVALICVDHKVLSQVPTNLLYLICIVCSGQIRRKLGLEPAALVSVAAPSHALVMLPSGTRGHLHA